jgi:3-dehydroquinate synthetase
LTRIEIQTRSKSYEVLIEQGLLRSAGRCIRETLPAAKRFVVITAAPIRRHWGKLLLDSFAFDGARVDVVEMADGERSKTLAAVE